MVRVLGADLNSNIPIREEETTKEYQAAYRKNNRGTILQQQAAWYKNNRETILQQRAAYYENNKETISQRGAVYYGNNKETQRFHCNVCNVTCKDNYGLKKHFDTYKHFMKWAWSVD